MLHPTGDDFALLRLIFLALLPIGGILLMVGRHCASPYPAPSNDMSPMAASCAPLGVCAMRIIALPTAKQKSEEWQSALRVLMTSTRNAGKCIAAVSRTDHLAPCPNAIDLSVRLSTSTIGSSPRQFSSQPMA